MVLPFARTPTRGDGFIKQTRTRARSLNNAFCRDPAASGLTALMLILLFCLGYVYLFGLPHISSPDALVTRDTPIADSSSSNNAATAPPVERSDNQQINLHVSDVTPSSAPADGDDAAGTDPNPVDEQQQQQAQPSPPPTEPRQRSRKPVPTSRPEHPDRPAIKKRPTSTPPDSMPEPPPLETGADDDPPPADEVPPTRKPVTKPPTADQRAQYRTLEKEGHELLQSLVEQGTVTDKWLTTASEAELTELASTRRAAFIEAFQHAWRAYAQFAWGKDELRPTDPPGTSDWITMGITILDSLSTLHVMGLTDEFHQAREFVATLDFNRDHWVPLFETIIRVLGGLLSAYDSTGDAIFIQKAHELGERLLPAFTKSASGVPYGMVNLKTGDVKSLSWAGGKTVLAEATTNTLEFLKLSYHTNDTRFINAALKSLARLDDEPKIQGVYPLWIETQSGRFSGSHLAVAGLGDSHYEYLTKMWIISGKRIERFRRMYLETMEGVKKVLLKHSPTHGYAYFAETYGGDSFVHRFDHLGCFMGGMMGLHTHHDPDVATATEDMNIAEDVSYTCELMYSTNKHGLSPEGVNMQPTEFQPAKNQYILRPEAVESWFVMNRITGEQKYREWGWDMFRAIVKNCYTPYGWAGIRDVTVSSLSTDDVMQSFFLAETLKYLFLLHSPSNVLSIDKYVFNTEAHPLKVLPDERAAEWLPLFAHFDPESVERELAAL